MSFTVTRSEETSDAEFVDYVRVLRQQGKGLGNLPRVPDPMCPNRRWAAVFETIDDAQKFVGDLLERTSTSGWRVEPITILPSVGPFGPIPIQLGRRSNGLVFGLHPLGLAIIREAHPDAKPALSSAFVSSELWDEYQQRNGTPSELVQEIIPILTGLNLNQLTEIGYVVFDDEDGEGWVYVPPLGVTHRHPFAFSAPTTEAGIPTHSGSP